MFSSVLLSLVSPWGPGGLVQREKGLVSHVSVTLLLFLIIIVTSFLLI